MYLTFSESFNNDLLKSHDSNKQIENANLVHRVHLIWIINYFKTLDGKNIQPSVFIQIELYTTYDISFLLIREYLKNTYQL